MIQEQTLVVDHGVINLQQCGLYASHRTAVLHSHHVCPESWFRAAGKPVGTPLLSVCPNCHYTIHAAIDGLLLGRSLTRLPPRCARKAREAFALAAQYGLTPAPTL